jgi:hypothetical protein
MHNYFILVANYTREHNPQLEANAIYPDDDSRQPSVKTGLSPLVAARIDLPISRSLLDQDIEAPIIRRCWEDQFLHKSNKINSILKKIFSF